MKNKIPSTFVCSVHHHHVRFIKQKLVVGTFLCFAKQNQKIMSKLL